MLNDTSIHPPKTMLGIFIAVVIGFLMWGIMKDIWDGGKHRA